MFTGRKTKIVSAFFVGIIVGGFVVVGVRYENKSLHISNRPVELSFAVAGRLSFVAPVGTKVAAGDIIAQLDTGALVSALQEAKADVVVEKAKVAELTAVGHEQQALTQKARQQASQEQQIALIRDSHTLVAALASVASTTRRAVAKADVVFTNASSTNPQLLIPADALSAAAAESGRVAVGQNIDNLVAVGLGVSASSSVATLTTAAQNVTADVAEIQLFLESLDFLEKQASTSSTISAVTLAGWQKGIAAARNGIDAVIYSILAAQDTLSYEENRSAVFAPETTVILDNQLAVHEAAQATALLEAQAAASSTAATLTGMVLRAPAAGVVAAPAAPARLPSVGQHITAGQSIVSFLATS